MAAKLGKQEDVIAEINVVPFVDIVLVLLIIFMVTSTAIVKAAIKVDLPKASAAGETVTSTVNLVFTGDRQLLVDGKEVTLEQGRSIIIGMVKENPDTQAVISADNKLPYGEVVELVDMVKLAGVSTFALNIERRQVAKK